MAESSIVQNILAANHKQPLFPLHHILQFTVSLGNFQALVVRRFQPWSSMNRNGAWDVNYTTKHNWWSSTNQGRIFHYFYGGEAKFWWG